MRATSAQDDADRGGLPRSVWTEERHQLTRTDVEVDASMGLRPPEAFVDGLQLGDG